MNFRGGADDGTFASALERIVRAALDEDLGAGDITTAATLDGDPVAEGRIVFKEKGVLAGMDAAAKVFELLDARVELRWLYGDGEEVPAGATAAVAAGLARPLLAGERTALNFLQRLSGVATLTRKFVTAVEGAGVKILDTRKTTPGLRPLEKRAVAAAGGFNHRMGLYDAVLIKDNHIALAGGIEEAVARVRARLPGKKIEVEAASPGDAEAALKAGADVIMLDNMSIDALRQTLAVINGKAETEVSGGVALDNVRAVAELGPDYISIGALTHSAPAVDISMEITKRRCRC